MLTILLSVKTANLFNIKTQSKPGGGTRNKKDSQGSERDRGKERERERGSDREKDSVSILAVKGKAIQNLRAAESAACLGHV